VTAALRGAAVLTLVCMAAGCSSGHTRHRPHPRPGFFGGGGAFVVGGVLVGAGLPGGKSGRPQITVPPIPPASSTQAITMPLDVYEQVESQEQDALSEAETLLTEQCMTARGFSYPAPASPNNGYQTLQAIEQDPFGLVSMSRAETFGYAQPKGSGGQGGPGFFGFVGGGIFASALNHRGPAYTMALFGFAPGAGGGGPGHQVGCFQQGYNEVFGRLGGNPNPDPVPGIAVQASQWAQTNPRVLAVDRAWSRCMAKRGYTFRNPQQAQQHHWPSAPTTVEVATAVADVSCKTQTNLPNTWLTIEAAYQRALVGQNLTVLSELQANFQGLLQRAEAQLGGTPLTP
jgi:hypothetical protein